MKETKRALRRHQFATKLKKRIAIWAKDLNERYESKSEYTARVLKGEVSTFLRTTGNPCQCWDCTGANKYIRPRKQYYDYLTSNNY